MSTGYQERVLRFSASLRPDQMLYTEVRHDDWCRHFKGVGACNCVPDIYVYDLKSIKQIGLVDLDGQFQAAH
jgi:hypothetical protein